MGTSGDKIVLLDGMGSGSGSAANGLLSMIPGMFTSLLGGNKMDPNLRRWSYLPLSKLKLKTLLTRFVLARCPAI